MTIDLATPADDQAGIEKGGHDGGPNSTVEGSGYGTFNMTTNANGTANGTEWQQWGAPDHQGRPLVADIIVCAIITWLIALTFVVLRFYTRTKLNNALGPADWCLIPSLVCSWIGSTLRNWIDEGKREEPEVKGNGKLQSGRTDAGFLLQVFSAAVTASAIERTFYPVPRPHP